MQTDNTANPATEEPIKPTVLDFNDISQMVPKLANHEKLVNRVLHWLCVDKVNDVHQRYCHTPGVEFAHNLLKDFNIDLRVDNREVLESLPEGAFVTVSNHPFGALDGISLISLVGSYRPDFKVMVNMILNHIGAMRPNFIAVDALASDDPAKQAVSKKGIMDAIRHVKSGHPIGFFPAGAVSKVNWKFQLRDRQWQPSIIRLIQKFNVPVVPIFFHGSNSWWFNFLGTVSWQLRTLRLPAEVWRKCNSTIHISIGEPIMPDQIKAHSASVEELGEFLKQQTYALRSCK